MVFQNIFEIQILWVSAHILHRTDSGKMFENEGGYSHEFGQTQVRKMRFLEELQNDSRKLLNEVGGPSRETSCES